MKYKKTSKSTERRQYRLERDSFVESKVLRNVENELLDEIDEAYFPPILSYNPIENAHDLTIEDSKNTYSALYSSFNALSKGEKVHTLLEESIMFSHSQFMYFATLFRELEKIIPLSDFGFSNSLDIPFHLIPDKKGSIIEEQLHIQPPIYLETVRNKYRIKYKSYGDKNYTNISPVMLYRFQYISMSYELTDFRDGYPSWYNMRQNGCITLFERYVPQLNRRVRIRWNKNEFEYHISGASDNWQKIYDVPLEMDTIIAALLFRK